MGFSRPSGRGMAVTRPTGRLRFGCCAAPESAIPLHRRAKSFGPGGRLHHLHFLPTPWTAPAGLTDRCVDQRMESVQGAALRPTRDLDTCPTCAPSPAATTNLAAPWV